MSLPLLSDYLPAGPFILDASAIINLLGCGEMAAVLAALGSPAIVEERTFREVNRHPVQGLKHGPVLDGLLSTGTMQVERMTDSEYDTYLILVQGSLAQRLDDGESAAIALTARDFPVVLDENKARKVVGRSFPSVLYFSTLRLFLTAAKRGSWPLTRVQQLVIASRQHARMGVPRDEQDLLARLMTGVEGWASQ